MNRMRSFSSDVRAINDERGPNGRPLCRQCRNECPPRRSAYCSEECRVTYLVPRVWAVAVNAVWQRDKGVCAICSRDTQEILKERLRLRALTGSSVSSMRESAFAEFRALIDKLRTEKFDVDGWYMPQGKLWQVDHIVPVVEGGGGCGIDGLRTLCTPCHKQVTAELAARRAQKRVGE